MEYEKPFLYIDTNFAPDEALMLYAAFGSYNFEIVGISTNAGLMSPKVAGENILGLAVVDDLYLPISPGFALEKSYEDQEIFTTSRDYLETMPAVENIIDKAIDCGKLDIIITGNLTNLALALDEAPEIEDYISHIFMLGGSLNGEVSENFLADAKAADKILATGIDIFILPDEVAKSVKLSDERLVNLRGTDPRLNRILEELLKIPANERYLGAALLLYLSQSPEAFIFEENGYRVDSQEEAGVLYRSSSRKNNYMVNKVNEDAFFDYLKGSLS